MPPILQGMWTNAAVAQAQIATWRAQNPDREVPAARVVPRDEEKPVGRPKTFSSLK